MIIINSTILRYCENSLCIYQKNHTCIIGEININEMSYCDSFVIVEIKKEILDKLKKYNRMK